MSVARSQRFASTAGFGALGAVTLALLMSACAGGSTNEPTLSAAAKVGQDTARQLGCVACHGAQGQGGVGPSWKGLAGSTVTLADGSTVTADDDYLRRAIREPAAQVVKGHSPIMPAVKVTDRQLSELLDYIDALR